MEVCGENDWKALRESDLIEETNFEPVSIFTPSARAVPSPHSI
jgi:hypothetical protein